MTIKNLIDDLERNITVSENTVDTVKAGDAEREVKKVAVAMFASIDTIRAAAAWGADFLIVHEPTYYNHRDDPFDDPVADRKKQLLEETGLTVYRYHDHPHAKETDMIAEGFFAALGLRGKAEKTPYFGSYRFTCETPVTALSLAEQAEKALGIAHIRICGTRDAACTKLVSCLGTPGGVFDLLRSPDTEIVITGEACEWMLGEYARDAAALGNSKTLLILGHFGSELAGMKLLAQRLERDYPTLAVRYFDNGEVYTYTDTKKQI